jgi:competence CoiA-like predicted nuclease
METLKNEIKKLAEAQVVLRDQRKSVYNKLDRTIQPSEAAWKHEANREKLRIMYAASGLLRGKTFNQIESSYPEENHPLGMFKSQIEKLIELHKSEFERKNEEVVHLSE